MTNVIFDTPGIICVNIYDSTLEGIVPKPTHFIPMLWCQLKTIQVFKTVGTKNRFQNVPLTSFIIQTKHSILNEEHEMVVN